MFIYVYIYIYCNYLQLHIYVYIYMYIWVIYELTSRPHQNDAKRGMIGIALFQVSELYCPDYVYCTTGGFYHSCNKFACCLVLLKCKDACGCTIDQRKWGVGYNGGNSKHGSSKVSFPFLLILINSQFISLTLR